MALSDCPKCWETPCICGYEWNKPNYKRMLDSMNKGPVVVNPYFMEQIPQKNLEWAESYRTKGNTLYIVPKELLLKLVAYTEYSKAISELEKIGIDARKLYKCIVCKGDE